MFKRFITLAKRRIFQRTDDEWSKDVIVGSAIGCSTFYGYIACESSRLNIELKDCLVTSTAGGIVGTVLGGIVGSMLPFLSGMCCVFGPFWIPTIVYYKHKEHKIKNEQF